MEVDRHIGGAFGQRPSEGDQFLQQLGNPSAERGAQRLHQLAALSAVGFSVGGRGVLIHRPGGFDLGMSVGGEQGCQAGFLLVGEQISVGVQGAPRPVERVGGAAAVPAGVQLDAAAFVEGVAGETDHMEGIHHRRRLGELFGGGGLESGEAIHGNDLHTVTPLFRALGQPLLEGFLGASLDDVEEAGGAGLVADRGQVDDDGDVLVAAAGVAPYMFVNARSPRLRRSGPGRR